jgi:hypothetical protein
MFVCLANPMAIRVNHAFLNNFSVERHKDEVHLTLNQFHILKRKNRLFGLAKSLDAPMLPHRSFKCFSTKDIPDCF